VSSTAVNQRKTRCEATARCAPPRHHGIASRLSPCRRSRQAPTKLTPHGTDEGSLSTCCSTRRLAHGSQPRTRTCTRTHARTRAQSPARACLCVSDDLRRSASCSPHTHVFGRSRPSPANRHLPPTGRIDAPPLLPPPGQLRPRGPVRVRDLLIGCHHPWISPGRFESRVGGM